MPDSTLPAGETVVLGERELAIGFRLIGLSRVVEVTPETAGAEFEHIHRADVAAVGATRALGQFNVDLNHPGSPARLPPTLSI